MPGQEFPEPTVDPSEYSSGFVLVYVAFSVPIVFLVVDLCRKSAEWFAPSGALALFVVAFVQARQFSRMQTKHFRNAQAASRKETIQGPSTTYQVLEKRVFWAALYGTVVWAYGDKLVRWLV